MPLRTHAPALLAAVAFALASCGETRCELTPALEEVAGPGAVSCGRVALGASTAAADACAVAALRANRPFWFAVQLMGIDSEVWSGIARAPDGAAYSLLWDGDPSGGSHIGARTQRSRCGALRVVVIDGAERVRCVDASVASTVCAP